jgi:hypothetical protein
MNKKESLREYFRRARHDSAVRDHLIRNARMSRTCMGWSAVIMAAVAIAESAFHGYREGVWLPGSAVFFSFSFVANLLIWDKFGDRIAAYQSMEEAAPQDAGEGTLR